ncbi:MAG: HIT domain-containing protein [Desulfocapsaceae bacterium]|nr:HIT domain-containing protein [Desulfocapsaceae bacterium]
MRGETPARDGCLFEPPGTSTSDEDSLLLYRDTHRLVLLNRYPYAHGHLLVAPARHIDSITLLQPAEGLALMEMLQTCTIILQKHFSPEGFNIGCNIGKSAGAGIAEHLHFHIVPRWNGDHNFMAVLADIKTIPEHLSATYNRLLPDFLTLTHFNSAKTHAPSR